LGPLDTPALEGCTITSSLLAARAVATAAPTSIGEVGVTEPEGEGEAMATVGAKAVEVGKGEAIATDGSPMTCLLCK